MKIYNKKGFWTYIISFMVYGLLTALASYLKGGSFSYTPTLFMLYVTFKGVSEAFSEEKSKINIEQERQKKEIMERHYGKIGKYITPVVMIAIVLCLVVMEFNFIAGLIMFVATMIIQDKALKPANDELRKINEAATQKKQSLE